MQTTTSRPTSGHLLEDGETRVYFDHLTPNDIRQLIEQHSQIVATENTAILAELDMTETPVDPDTLWNKLLSNDTPLTSDERRALRRLLLTTKVARGQTTTIPTDDYPRLAGGLGAIVGTFDREFTTGGTP